MRDLRIWVAEANLKAIRRKAELYNAALLPNLKSEDIKREVGQLTERTNEIEHEEEIEGIEKKAREHFIEMKTHARGPVKRTWKPPKKRKLRRL